jgi:hypothetical protein
VLIVPHCCKDALDGSRSRAQLEPDVLPGVFCATISEVEISSATAPLRHARPVSKAPRGGCGCAR